MTYSETLATPPAAVLRAEHLTKTYGTTHALQDVSVGIRAGESVAIMGPSGSGKTTLMHVLSGIITPDAGRVSLRLPPGHGDGAHELTGLDEDRRAAMRRTALGFVFQDGLLLPELTARENVAVALMVGGTARSEAESRAQAWLDHLGLAGLGDRRPGQLSGGQAQRVAIARAQVTGPAVVFADEPTGALDSATSEHVLTALLESTAARSAPLVVVTHDETVAARCARLIRLEDGRITHDSLTAGEGVRA